MDSTPILKGNSDAENTPAQAPTGRSRLWRRPMPLLVLVAGLLPIGVWSVSQLVSRANSTAQRDVPREIVPLHPGKHRRPSGDPGEAVPDREASMTATDVAGTVSAPTTTGDSTTPDLGVAAVAKKPIDFVLGDWEDDYSGKRSLTVRADGTATMVCEPSGLGATLFAPRLQFEIDWKLVDNELTFTTRSGEPKTQVDMVLNLYGRSRKHPIIELTADRMLLLDPDGTTKYDWRRPKPKDRP